MIKKMSDEGGGELGFNAPIGEGSFEIAKIFARLVTQAIADVLLCKGYNLNTPLPTGNSHNVYVKALKEIIVPKVERFNPDMIIIACSFDANALDSLARMQLSSELFHEMTLLILETAEKIC